MAEITDAGAPLKSALYEAISGLGITTYTVRPQASDGADGAVYPHIQIGPVLFNEWDAKAENGFDFIARIHTRWRGGSEFPGLQIQGELYRRLHNGDLTIDGFELVLMQRQLSDVTRLADGSFDGVCEYSGLIEAA